MTIEVDGKIQELWENVVISCNKILHNAELYGFQLMEIPDPNVHMVKKMFDQVVIPLLDDLANDYEFSPESGLKIANIRVYALHLRAISIALIEDDEEKFHTHIDLLLQESMLL